MNKIYAQLWSVQDYTSKDFFGTLEQIKDMGYAEIFTRIGEKCKNAGLTFAYHNHAHEFVLDQGQYPLDVLFKNTDSKYVKIQPDLFWVAYAGLDPIQYLTQNLDRIPIIHLKQIKDMETKANVDAGSGIINFSEVIRLAPNADFVYEQEEFVGTSIENMEKSMKYFSSI